MNVIKSPVLLLLASLALIGLLILSGASSESSSSKSTSTTSSSSSSTNKHNPHYTTATQSRASTAASLLGAIGSLVPGIITNIAPLVLLVGIGALMMPSLGLGAMGLLRESRRSGNDQAIPTAATMNPLGALPANFASYARPLQTSPQDIYYFTKRSFPGLMSSFNTGNIMSGLQEVLERVGRAIENADKRYK